MHLVDITLFYAAEGGGVSTYLNAKAAWLARHGGWRHTVVAPDGRAANSLGTEEWLDTTGNTVFLPAPGRSLHRVNGYQLPRSISGTAALLASVQPDLIEVGDACHFAWAALRAGAKLKVPVVGFYHSDLARVVQHRYGALAAGIARRYTAQLYQRFDLTLAPSRSAVRTLRELGVERVQHQPLGVDTTSFTPARRDPQLRAQLGLPTNARLLVYAGRSTPEKKLALLVSALGQLGAPYYLLQIGGPAAGGVTAGRPRSSVAAAKLSDAHPSASARVLHLPFQRNPAALARLLASCDLLVHPGDQETFGLVVLEAMACGLPVLGVDAGGVAELIDATNGLLVRPGSAAALAEGIAALYREDLAAMGAQARRKVVTHYDWNIIFPQLMGQYATVQASHALSAADAGLSLAAE